MRMWAADAHSALDLRRNLRLDAAMPLSCRSPYINSKHLSRYAAAEDALLLVPWIQPHLKNTERLQCPKQQPWLTGVLTDISLRKSLYQAPNKILHMGIFL